MGKIEMEGTYQGPVLEHGVGKTSNGFPQWIARIAAHRLYITPEIEEAAWFKDGDYEVSEDRWLDIESWGWTITGYFVLFNKEKALLNYEQVQAATGWDGGSFKSLAALDVGFDVQFRVEENEYKGDVTLRAEWIDSVDAPPDRSLQALDGSTLDALGAEYAGLMSGGKPAPARASKPAKGGAKGKGKPPAKGKGGPPKASKPAAEESGDAVVYTQSTGWEYLVDDLKLDESAVGEKWLEAAAAIGKDDEGDFTDEDWTTVTLAVRDAMQQPA